METPREDGGPRSPKRQAHGQPLAQTPRDSSARAVVALDAAIWTSIIEFLPMPKDVILSVETTPWSSRTKYSDALISQVVATWRTLLNLRYVSKELAPLLHPVDNRALWKRLLLQSFDFAADGGFNVDNYQEEHGLKTPASEGGGEEQAQTNGQTEQDPQLVAMRGRYRDMPREYLEEDLENWSKLGIYHRPSQYGFLTTLQQQPPVGVWPESEDPFTLFGDLVRLLMLPHGERMSAGGEASDTTFKYLVAPTEADSSSRYFRFYVMKTLGYVPHFWHWGSGIGNEWKGFTDTDGFDTWLPEKLSEDEKGDEANEDEDEDEDEDEVEDEDEENNGDDGYDEEDDTDFDYCDEFSFPSSNVRQTKRLYQNIREHCQDWRAVCCNKGSDGVTPVFFVGESKALPHRWIGYAGKKCWT